MAPISNELVFTVLAATVYFLFYLYLCASLINKVLSLTVESEKKKMRLHKRKDVQKFSFPPFRQIFAADRRDTDGESGCSSGDGKVAH